ncbi:MAG TPA: tail-specific protease [Oxalobacteraceae bacterium]|nr:tail-specific protease [Oxalobacteraceae bacterium]
MCMKNRLLWILLAIATASHAAVPAPSAPPILAPLQQQGQAAALAAQVLTRHHYKAVPLDDAMSEKIFDRYVKTLDPEKLFFIQADIDKFAAARTELDDAIYHEDLHIPFAIFNLFQRRVVERLAYAREILKQDHNFSRVETYQYERSKEPWPKSEDEARDLWRKRVKNDWLRLKLAGKDDKMIRATLAKRYGNSLARAYKSKSDDVFQVFMDAYAMSIEPHTDYLGPRASAEFDIAMRLSLVGIGAVLQERDEYTTIRELVPGGPAAQSAKLHVGDRIVGVGQGNDGPVTDVVGWRVDDVVTLIRGAKDSVVRLDILPADAGPDGQHKHIALVRNKISLEQQAAKKSIIRVKDGAVTRQVGVIVLPTFYQDFDARRRDDKNYKSATRDVAVLLEELKKDKVDAVLIDLRNNGGGSLDEAVELTGLFTGEGPVVQERNSQGNVRIDSSHDTTRAWDGPLGVLINRASASASEIFAAAIQDYGRGVIIGEPSFGKGTVQTLVNFDQMAHSDKPKLGELKMTVAQFFRVNGGTTQLRGVTPDISFPTVSDTENFGESSYDNALPWTQIKAANYASAGNIASWLPSLQSRHTLRIASDKDFQYLLEDVARINAQRKKHVLSLNEADRRKERDLLEARLASRADSSGADGSNKKSAKEKSAAMKKIALQDLGLQADERSLSDELAAEKAQKDAKDVWLNEATHILSDEVDLSRGKTELAARIANGKRE